MANYGLRIGQLTGYPLAAGAGSYALSGQTAGLTYTPASGAEPYTWYTPLDKLTIPFHAGAVESGTQQVITEAQAPTGAMVDVTASSAAELISHIYTPNRRITITGNISGATCNAADITDVDIIIPPGRVVSNLNLGNATLSLNRRITRLRIRGNTVGSYSGGQLHNLSVFGTAYASAAATDLIIDGIDHTGPASGAFTLQGNLDRLAVTNVKAASGGYYYLGTAGNPIFTNCSIITGLDTAAQNLPEEEAWGARFAHETKGNIIVYGCDIRSNPLRVVNSHARIRMHPDTGLNYAWIKSNRFVEMVENWLCWVDAAAGGGTGDIRAVWWDTNESITSGTGTSHTTFGLVGPDLNYAYIQNSEFKSDYILSGANLAMQGIINGTAGRSNLTFSGLIAAPSTWLGPGDPSGLNWNI